MNINNKEIEEILTNLGDVSKRIEDKNVLVTGGAGFLGSWICKVLMEEGARVTCLDNIVSGLKSNISSLMDRDNFKFIQHDITQPIFFDEPLDMVMHLASRASPFEFEKYPIQILKANTLGIWVALGIAKKHSAKFLYTYGPRMRSEGVYGRVVPRFVEQALSNEPITVFGSGEQTRSFCYVTDQVVGLLRLAFLEKAEGEVVNIGSDEEINIIELANMIKDLTNSRSEIMFEELPKDDPPRRKPEISKAKRILGWKPRVKLKEGLKRTIEWFEGREK